VEKKGYETNFTLTGFDRDPVTSLIVEAKKEKNMKKVNIVDKRNYDYSLSLMDDKNFQEKCKNLNNLTKKVDNQMVEE